MENFDVWFEIYGKKLKTTVCAETEKDVQNIIKNKIVFHKIEKIPIFKPNPNNDKTFEDLLDMFGMKP